MFQKWLTLCALVVAVCVAAPACSKDPETRKRTHYDRGIDHFDRAEYKEAIIAFRNAVRVDPRFGEARFKLAQSYAQVGDLQNAAREHIRAADLLPQDVEVQLAAARYLLLSGRFDEARARADQALATDPTSIDAQILRANALAGLKDLDGALREIEEAIRMDPAQSRGHTTLGALQMARGELAEAEAAYLKAVEAEPGSVLTHLALANFYWSTGRPGEAEQSLLQARTLDPRNPLTNRALAMLYVTTNRAEEAEEPLKAWVAENPDPRAGLVLADYYVHVRRPTEALAVLEALTAHTELFTIARTRVAAIQFAEGLRADAHLTLDDVLGRDARHVDAHVLKARFLLQEGKTEEALSHATQALDADPRSALAHYAAGLIQTARGSHDEAISAFGEVIKLNPRAVAAQMHLATLHLNRGSAATSLQFAEEAVRSIPQSPTARFILARALMARGELTRAESEMKPLLAAHPNVAAVHAQMGTLQLLKKDLTGARRSFERARSLDSVSLEALRGLVQLDLMANRPADARARVEESLAQRPQDTALLLVAGRAYAQLQDFAKAEESLRKAIDADPTSLDAYGALGGLYFAQGRLDQARQELEALIERQPRSVPAHTMVGMILQAQNRPDEALKRYEQTLQIDPRAAVAANNLAYMYAEADTNLDTALQLAQTARQQLDRAEVTDTLGWIYYKKGMVREAVPFFRESIEKDPSNPLYHYHLGLAAHDLGDVVTARRSLARALEMSDRFDGAEEARQIVATLPP
jgi:putative PEP-CTERM system TPR-repeat lipoprotein